MSDELLKQGQEALKAGDRLKARQLLQSAVQQDPQNETAWLWLAGSVKNDFERVICLEKVLAINPNNAGARKALDRIKAALPQVPSAPAEMPSVPPVIDITPAQPVYSPVPSVQVKTCPGCQRNIPADARICPYCGGRFYKDKISRMLDNIPVFRLVLLFLIGAVLVIFIFLGGDILSLLPNINPSGGSRTYSVKYEITGSAASVSITMNNSQGGTQQLDHLLPFAVTYTFDPGDFAYISAQNNGEYGSVTCRIWVDGVKWKESTSSGAYKIADCSGFIGTK